MRKPDCYLIRLGEIALKSEQVRKVWFRTQLRNIKAVLPKVNIKTEPNRIFIYSKTNPINKLKKVFGITSISPTWICEPTIEDMSKLSIEIAKNRKMKKFRIRSRRAGNHSFTSQDIAIKAGAAVVNKLKLKVDLTKGKEINIECRQKKAYIFTDKITGPGGLPLGTAGRIAAIVNTKESLVAAWFMMKRGCVLDLYGKKYEKTLSKWHVGQKMNVFSKGSIKNAENMTVSVDNKTKLKGKYLIVRPMIALNYKKFLTQIGE